MPDITPPNIAKLENFHFTDIVHEGGDVKSCSINAQNLWLAFNHNMVPVCDELSVDLSGGKVAIRNMFTVEADKFRGLTDNIGFHAKPRSERHIEMDEQVLTDFAAWLKRLPVNHITFFSNAFPEGMLKRLAGQDERIDIVGDHWRGSAESGAHER